MKKLSLILALSLVSFASNELKSDIQKESYAIGVSTGNYLVNQVYKQQQLGIKTDIDLLLQGFKDAFKNKQKLKDEEVIGLLNKRAGKLNELQEKQFNEMKMKNAKKEKAFLAKSKKGNKQTKSGLIYKIAKQGKGKKVRPESVVLINYKASLANGYVFDDTYARKTPAHLSMINIVDGLKEGLMLLKEGGEAKFIIPSKLGYGSVQMRDIPPNSPLIFEVQLLRVLKPGSFKAKPHK